MTQKAIIPQGQDSAERVTIIVPSFDQAAFEIHRQNMWDKGYRLEARIQAHQFFESNGKKLNTMFDGAIMYAATFVRV